MKTKSNAIRLIAVIMLFVLLKALPVNAGNLEPPAAPDSTMKTLDEVEPRIPIPASDTPTGAFIISQSGSYYLTGNRLCTGTGISVGADDVTIDLSGFALIGPNSLSTVSGISMFKNNNVEIRNGTIRDFGYGIQEIFEDGENYRIINIRSISNVSSGIILRGHHHLVQNCVVSDNGTSASTSTHGIWTNHSCTITGNIVARNGVSATGVVNYGIVATNGSTITGNTVYDNGNGATGIVYGIRAEISCTVTGNTVYKNGDTAGGDIYGIYANVGCTVKGNTAYDNGDGDNADDVYGIYATLGSTVIGNTAYSNGTSATGSAYGIYLGGYNAVDQNTTYKNGASAASATNMDLTIATCAYGTNVAPPP